MICQLHILPQGKRLEVPAGANLLQVLRDAGLGPEAPCGGKGTCGKCTVTVNGQPVRSCRFQVESDLTVVLPEAFEERILTQGAMGTAPADPVAPGYLVAVDVGTTTVVCVLMDAAGNQLAVQSMKNPQAPWGADVISRIQHACGGAAAQLTQAIRQGVEALLQQCCREASVDPRGIGVISLVGNSCMQQMFLGMDVQNLAAIPFAPSITQAQILNAASYIACCPQGKLLVVPDIAGFVGADTMACILAARLHEAQDTVLLVDIGTNGEMVLCHKGAMAACSTAAGPALEGGNISCGMRAAAGAIDHVWDGGCSVIGNAEARGICGSGLVDAAAVMLDAGILNYRGRLQTPDHTYTLKPGVTLTQDDIRQLQMAKGAIAAGILLLAEHMSLEPEAIDRVILAGAFGSFLDPQNACRIGLLPQALEGKITAAGNLALRGAEALAMDQKLLPLTQQLLGRIASVELAKSPDFEMTFAENMYFPED